MPLDQKGLETRKGLRVSRDLRIIDVNRPSTKTIAKQKKAQTIFGGRVKNGLFIKKKRCNILSYVPFLVNSVVHL